MMRVALGKFARREIEAAHGSDLAAGLHTALRHYARRLASGPAPVGPPRFALATSAPGPLDLEVAVERDVEQALERELGRQDASLGQLMTHAVFVYLADRERPPEAPESSEP